MKSLDRPPSQRLSDKLRQDLDSIPPSHAGDLNYWPCTARLKDGTELACVYVVADGPYIKHWGGYPEQDRHKRYICVSDVEALAESPHRLPAQFANKLYVRGESGMGYTIFTVVFSDGSRQACRTGNAVDFIRYPKGEGPRDVSDVLPHEGRKADPVPAPDYYWCLFSD
jgi:hypothetical protein